VLDLKYHWSVYTLSALVPLILVNGRHIPARWGRNVIPVPPGQSHVHIHVPYPLLSRIGAVDTTVWLGPGETVELEYRAPMWMLSSGALGPAPQKWPGKAYLYLVLVIWLILMLIITLSLVVD